MVKNGLLACVLVALLLMAGGACAGTVDDLRATLHKMQAEQPIKATLKVRSKVVSGDEDKPKTSQAKLSFGVQATGGSLELAYPSALLKRVDAESNAAAGNPDKSEPVQDLVGRMGPLKVRSLLNVAPLLLHLLDGAKLKSTKADTYAGKPVQQLVFELPAKMSSEDRDAIDHYDGTLNIWLGGDGVPVAFSEARHFKGSKFFIDFSFGSSVSMSLRKVGQRLVAGTVDYHSTGAGMGNSSKTDTHVELTLAAQTHI